jgi:hypothetical protein
MPRHFQDDNFEMEQASGDTLLELVGFSERGPLHPEKLLLHLERCGWCSCFLSAFIAHWDALADTDVEEVVHDHTNIPRTDYCDEFPLRGVRVRSITCARADGRTSVTIVTDARTLVLREVDGSDPHTDSELLWYPRPPR